MENRKRKILLVEDEQTLLTIISETLSEQGFKVSCARDGESGLTMFKAFQPDLIIADVMMPKMDGFEMAREIRKSDTRIPLLFMTARSSIEDVEEGFSLGADDYIRKPFKMKELILRVKALLKRCYNEPNETNSTISRCLQLGKYEFDTVGNKITYDDHIIELTNLESKLLALLAEREGQTVMSSELMKHIWNHDDYYNRNSLHGYIHKLRNHLRHDSSINIMNIRGFGYRLVVNSGTQPSR